MTIREMVPPHVVLEAIANNLPVVRIDILGKYMTDIGGIPAKLIKMRFTEEEIKEHERK